MSYDHTQLYVEQIEPLLQDAYNICTENKVPLLILTGVAGTESGDHLRHSQCMDVPEIPTIMGLFAALLEDQELAGMCMQLLAAKLAVKAVVDPEATRH